MRRAARRIRLSICVLLVLAAGAGWAAGWRWGIVELWDWQVNQETHIWAGIQEGAFVIQKWRSYQLRVNEQVPEREVNLFLLRWRTSCESMVLKTGVNPPGWSGMYPTVVSEVAVPFWSAMLISGLDPLVALSRGPMRRWRHGRRGCCRKCGYDLTGNVSGMCPECGTAVPDQASLR